MYMKRIILALVAAITCLTGCDLGKQEREAAEKIYKANSVARKQCEAKLQGLKQVPIAGTGGKLYLDADKLPIWNISRGFRSGDECGATQLGFAYETFYWNGQKIIPKYIWIQQDGHSLMNKPKDWMSFIALVRFGQTIERKIKYPEPSIDKLQTREEVRVIRLKNYPLDAWPVPNPKAQDKFDYRLSLREWPIDNNRPRFLDCSGDISGKTSAEIESSLEPLACQLDFPQFHFKAGAARISVPLKKIKDITPALQAFQQYLNDSIIEKEQQ